MANDFTSAEREILSKVKEKYCVADFGYAGPTGSCIGAVSCTKCSECWDKKLYERNNEMQRDSAPAPDKESIAVPNEDLPKFSISQFTDSIRVDKDRYMHIDAEGIHIFDKHIGSEIHVSATKPFLVTIKHGGD